MKGERERSDGSGKVLRRRVPLELLVHSPFVPYKPGSYGASGEEWRLTVGAFPRPVQSLPGLRLMVPRSHLIFRGPRMSSLALRLFISSPRVSIFWMLASTFLTLVSTLGLRLTFLGPSMSSETIAFEVLGPRLFKKAQTKAQNIKRDGPR